MDKRKPGPPLADRLNRLRSAPIQVIMHRVRRYRRNILDAPHEIRLGIRTRGLIDKFAGGTEQVTRYEAVPYRTLHAIAKHMAARGIAAPRFVDVGAGLGRPLYFFAPQFEELIGYELVEPIHALALTQLARARARRPQFARISLECADATTALPLDRPQVVFLYNPFGPKPMARFCERLRQARNGVHVYYVKPDLADMIAERVTPLADMFRRDFTVAYFHLPAGPSPGT
jgi:hypothetical protein